MKLIGLAAAIVEIPVAFGLLAFHVICENKSWLLGYIVVYLFKTSAPVGELVDALVLEISSEKSVGSIPSEDVNLKT